MCSFLSSLTCKIYDTAGQEDFSAVRDQYIRIGEGFICMYSITNDASFQEMSGLREKLSDITEDENHPVVLVGKFSSKTFRSLIFRKQMRHGGR